MQQLWAIATNGIGEEVYARPIRPGWSLLPVETFTAEEWKPGMRLAADGASLRNETPAEKVARESPPIRSASVDRSDPIFKAFLKVYARRVGLPYSTVEAEVLAELPAEV